MGTPPGGFSVDENIDAVHVLPNGHIILSTVSGATLGGLTFLDGDLVDYDPVGGTATMFLPESIFTAGTVNIDAVYVRPTGLGCTPSTGAGCKIIVSATGNATLDSDLLTTYSQGDLFEIDPTVMPNPTATLFLDESVFAGSADIDGVHVLPNGHIVLSVGANETIGGLSIAPDDLAEYDPVSDTATLFFDGTLIAGGANIDAVYVGCGNGTTEGDEDCDDAGESAACNENCTTAICGDGILNVSAGEECDDGNLTDDGNGCDASCNRNDVCGDGTVQSLFESCDDGNTFDTGNGCDGSCNRNGVCGDAKIQSLFEQCDDGDTQDTGNGCSTTCQRDGICGDSNVEPLFEECDTGGSRSDITPDACRTDCTNPGCGDGVTDNGETCDDAGESATCDTDCTTAQFGDGVVNGTAGEQCDDGNLVADDGCDASGQFERVGLNCQRALGREGRKFGAIRMVYLQQCLDRAVKGTQLACVAGQCVRNPGKPTQAVVPGSACNLNEDCCPLFDHEDSTRTTQAKIDKKVATRDKVIKKSCSLDKGPDDDRGTDDDVYIDPQSLGFAPTCIEVFGLCDSIDIEALHQPAADNDLIDCIDCALQNGTEELIDFHFPRAP